MGNKYTPKQIYSKSKTLSENIKNKQTNGQTSKWAYYYCKCILNGKKDVTKITQADAKNITGKSINKKLTKAEYLEVVKRYVAWVEKNKKLPNYITVKGVQIKPTIWNAYVGSIYKVYYETGKLPSSQTIKSDIYGKKTTNKLYDYMTNTGCSGMGQCTGYYCGCNSLQQCFYRLTGIQVKESTIAEVAGTTSYGTDHYGLNTAVAWFNKKYNQKIKITWYNFSDVGWSKLSDFIKNGAVFCHLLYRDQYGHYEVPKSVGENDLKILNSLGNQCGSGTYCGYIETRSKSTQKRYIQGISQKSIAVLTKE